MDPYIRPQQLQAGEVWRLEKVLGVVVQLGAQDGGNGPGDTKVARTINMGCSSRTDVSGQACGTWPLCLLLLDVQRVVLYVVHL